MKKLLLLIVLFVSAISFSQTPELADEYWDKAEKAVEIKDWENAALFYEKSVEAVKKCETPRLRDLMASLNNSAFYYKKVNDYDKSLNLYYEGLEVVEELISAKHPNYAKQLNRIAEVYFILGQYELALEFYQKSLEVLLINLNENQKEYYDTQSNIAAIYRVLGQHLKSNKLYVEVLMFKGKEYGYYHPETAKTLTSLTGLIIEAGLYQEALPLCKDALSIKGQHLGKNNLEYIKSVNQLAYLYQHLESFDKALPYNEEALELTNKVLGKEHEMYATVLNNLAFTYENLNKNQEALKLYFESLNIIKNSIGEKHPRYAVRLNNIGNLCIKLDELDESYAYFIKANNILWSNIGNVFKFTSEVEKQDYLNLIINEFKIYQSVDKLNDFKSPEFLQMNLNNQYLLKGLLLNDYTNMLKDLSQLNDKDIITLISEYRKSYVLLSKQITTPINERIYDVDSLQNSVHQKESELVKKHNQLFDSNALVLDWKTVQNKLTKDEVVVEFSKFQFRNKDGWTKDHLYVAYVFDKQSSSPTPIYLFEENELKQVLAKASPSNLYKVRGSKATSVKVNTSEALYNLIWKSLENHFADKQTIYFSPSGKLNQLALVALPNERGKLMLSKYNMYQMSNTANLVQSKTKVEQSPAIFTGGIQYNFNPDKTTLNQKEKVSLNLLDTSKRNNQNGTWQYLPGTEEEANKLNKLYKEENLNATIVRGEDATEEWFKSLSGNSPKVLHIATHGFFFEDIKDTLSYRNEQPKYTLAKDPLLRSGLILAHGNYTWQHGTNPYKEEDGILTAYEISKLDFQNTDMVVLSACETGLGDIDGSEGVYGLQRAFKMAGVDIIVMSLWEVPDAETSEFMQLFYSNWLEEQPVREAFRNTQRTMSAKYKDSPDKWAAFVLIE